MGTSMGTLLRVLTVGPVVERPSGRSIGVLAVKQGPAHFERVAQMCVTGRVEIHIDRVSRSTRCWPRSPASVRGVPLARSSSR